jgi:hypothetical protein
VQSHCLLTRTGTKIVDGPNSGRGMAIEVPLRIVRGDATSPQAKGPKVIAHICNDLGGWGKGFVLAISRKWPEPERDYRDWHRHRAGNDFGLGAVRLVPVQADIWVANMIGQHGMRSGSNGPPIRYPAVGQCLQALGDRVEPLIDAALCQRGVAVTVYDFDA